MTGAGRAAPLPTVEPGDPRDPRARDLLARSHALMTSLFPPEENAHLDVAALAAPEIRFLWARRGAEILGTGALALRADHAEVKSMFTAPAARGQGVGDAVLRALIDLAAAEGVPRLRLETGRGLDAACRLYERHGFRPRGPFGSYRANGSSLFYERAPDAPTRKAPQTR